MSVYVPVDITVCASVCICVYICVCICVCACAGGNVDGHFYLDEITGRLSCSPLDRELVPAYNLSITATDHAPARYALSSTTHLLVRVVDDNDNDPVFMSSSYSASVSEAAGNGSSVLTVSATDLDEGLNGHVSYSLSNSSAGIFKVDSNSGLITTAGSVTACVVVANAYNTCIAPQAAYRSCSGAVHVTDRAGEQPIGHRPCLRPQTDLPPTSHTQPWSAV